MRVVVRNDMGFAATRLQCVASSRGMMPHTVRFVRRVKDCLLSGSLVTVSGRRSDCASKAEITSYAVGRASSYRATAAALETLRLSMFPGM